jgi:GNAT superfamily N-acetyltransferase
MDATGLKKRPMFQVVAGQIARFFGIHFYDLYYGQKDLLSCSQPVVPLPKTHVRMATPEDLNRIICRIGGEIQKEFDHNIAIDSTCYVAVHESIIAGYLWVNRQIIDLTGMYLAGLPPRKSFVHNVFVFPEHRRKGIFQFLFYAACLELQKAGFFSIACLVDKANTLSVKAFKCTGIRFHNAIVLKLPGVKPVLICRALA